MESRRRHGQVRIQLPNAILHPSSDGIAPYPSSYQDGGRLDGTLALSRTAPTRASEIDVTLQMGAKKDSNHSIMPIVSEAGVDGEGGS